MSARHQEYRSAGLTFGEALADARKRFGYTLQQMAEHLEQREVNAVSALRHALRVRNERWNGIGAYYRRDAREQIAKLRCVRDWRARLDRLREWSRPKVKGVVRWELRDATGNYLADIVRRACSKVPWCYRVWSPDGSKTNWGYVASVARAKREAEKWLARHVS